MKSDKKARFDRLIFLGIDKKAYKCNKGGYDGVKEMTEFIKEQKKAGEQTTLV